jgi:two-component sensor histidine kinase
LSELSPPRQPWTEIDRLAALDRYHVLDTPSEANYDDLVRLAAQICGKPMALISLVDARRQWFKAALGLSVGETTREIAFCAHAIQQTGVFTVTDAARDPRFADNPLVTADPNLRFYCGATLLTSDGFPLGTICVLDTKPGALSEDQVFALQALSRQVMVQLDLRLALIEREKADALRVLLMDELKHRVRNTLSVVQAIANQSLRAATSVDEAKTTINARLMNLAKAHDVLTEGHWNAAPLADVIEASIAETGLDQSRFDIEGPVIELGPRAALGLALAFHELTTNAVKFGALSNAEGRVRIGWRVEPDSAADPAENRLWLQWRERGGPPVKAPRKQAFGSRLIQSALRGGTCDLAFNPEGLVCTFTAPLKDLAKLST